MVSLEGDQGQSLQRGQRVVGICMKDEVEERDGGRSIYSLAGKGWE